MLLNFSEKVFDYLKSEKDIALACSGGGDSVALFHTLQRLFPSAHIHLLHFNHNLRAGAVKDEKFVQKLGNDPLVTVHVGLWKNPRIEGNIQQLARQKRYKFFQKKCEELKVKSLLVAHTQDDLLETFFMRLGRGSGLTGLASLKEITNHGDLIILRPLLRTRRLEIRSFLKKNKFVWREDSSNFKTKFLRIRLRFLLKKFSAIGLDKQAISASILSLGKANESLEFFIAKLYSGCFCESRKTIDYQSFKDQPVDVQERLIDCVLKYYFPEDMTPRTSKKTRLCDALMRGEKASLGGVVFEPKNDLIYTAQEHPNTDS